MYNSENCKPNLQTYSMLFNLLLRRFNKLNVCYMYLQSAKSLSKQMKAAGVIPDTYVLNMIIKAYSKCLEVDEAIRVFREMGLYGCEPNAYTYQKQIYQNTFTQKQIYQNAHHIDQRHKIKISLKELTKG